MKKITGVMILGALLSGCATDYNWRSSVPEAMRTVSVPTFRNESKLAEFGPIATRQILREFQREGTFAIRPAGEAAVEVQGVVKSISLGTLAYNRRSGLYLSSCEMTAIVEVSVIDKAEGRVLIDDRTYDAHTTLVAGQDRDTAERDAAGRLADDLSRKVVDDILNIKW